MGLHVSLTCREPTDVRLGSTSWLTSSNSRGSDYPDWPSSWWSFDVGAILELLKTYMQFKSHLPISWDFSHCFYMSLFLYAFDLSFSWCLISIPHCRPFSSVCWKCDSYNCYSPALPDYTPLWFAHQLDLIWDTQQEDKEECTSKGHFCLRRVLLEGMFPCYTCAGSHPSPGLPVHLEVWLEL